MIKVTASDSNLRNKISLYSNYQEPDPQKPRYVMTDETDIVICNKEGVESYLNAGFIVFGSAENEEDLQKLIAKAEQS